MPAKRYSRQRELIYQALCNTTEHPTADMVYQRLKADNPTLSLGTVYRNLNLLVEEERIRSLPFQVERYDARTDPHPHFVCRCCGGVMDLELPYDSDLDLKAAQFGHQVENHSVVFNGVCSKCGQVERC